MIHKYLRLRKRASKDASGNSTTPRTGSLDLVNRGDRPFVRTADNDEAGLLAEAGTPINSVARVDTITFAADGVVDGEKIAYGDEHFEFNASDGTTPSNVGATPVKAQGTITLTNNPADGGTMDIGCDATGATMQYRFKTTPVQTKDIKIGSTVAETCDYIIAAINGTDGLGASSDPVFVNTPANNQVTAANGTSTTVVVTAKYNGSTGDAVVFDESATHLTMDGGGTLGATRAGVDPQYTPIDITSTSTKAVGTLTFIDEIRANDQVKLGDTTYTAIANGQTPVAGQFNLGSGTAGNITNLIAAINGTDGVNTANASATAASGAGATLVATAKVGGAASGAIASTDPTDDQNHMSWGASTLAHDGGVTDENEAAIAAATAINGRAAFSAVRSGATVVVTHTLHGTVPNGYKFNDAVDAGNDISNATTTAGVAGTEGVAGAQYEDDNYLYTCTSANATNEAYTWKKSPIVALSAESFGSTTCAGDTLAIPVTHRIVQKTTGGDAEALTIVDGVPGQKLTIILTTDGGGDGTLTVGTNSTGTGWATAVFADAKDTLNLEYINDTVGWIITGRSGPGTDGGPIVA